READIINNFQFPIPMANLTKFSEGDGKGKGIMEIYAAAAQKISPADVRRITEYTNLPVIVKGSRSSNSPGRRDSGCYSDLVTKDEK
ncbi:hypothetical protein NL524_27845, partial [Klebsiella pneumoniae]|nr:hypothetical protein [Klebsiella pneumoniae]